MNQTKFQEWLEEAAKVLHMDASHSALHSKIQEHLSANHRAENPNDSYYNHPYVQDVYGNGDSGTVVYSQGGKHTMANFKSSDGKLAMSGHKPVKRAYVPVSGSMAESETGGDPLVTKVGTEIPIESLVEFSEAAAGLTKSRIKIIGPGQGDKAYYTPLVIEEACKNGVWSKGMQMFLDHQTEAERKARPEGSVKDLVGVLTSNAMWESAGSEGPGAYADANFYPEYSPFLKARYQDIGLSMRGLGAARPAVIDGRNTLYAESISKCISIDVVTRAGAKGKIVEMYESFQGGNPNPGGERAVPAIQKESQMAKVEIDEKELKTLQESAALVPGLVARLDRLDESNSRLVASGVVTQLLQESKLPARSQTRVGQIFTSPTSVVPMKDGKVDTATLTESVKAEIKAEEDYLQESGITLRPKVVRIPGAGAPAEDVKDQEKLLTESASSLDDSLASISGRKKEKVAV